jgi:hypothetical protein
MSYEYTQPLVGRGKCQYSSLGRTYGGLSALNEMSNNTVYSVPGICPSGDPNTDYPPALNTLYRSLSGCGDKPTLGRAYPSAGCNTCMGVPNPTTANAMLAGPNGRVFSRGCASRQVSGCQ